MSDNYTTIVDNIRAKVPGVLDGMITLELGNTANEFLDSSNVWQDTINITTVAGKLDYVAIPTEGEITRLMGVVLDTRRVPATFTMPDTLSLTHDMGDGQLLKVTFSLVPDSTDALNIPDWVWLKFRHALIEGTLGRLMSQIAKPYANERMAIYHMRRFRNFTAQARVEALREYNYAGQAWAFPRSFR